jgi:hypothetical protein
MVIITTKRSTVRAIVILTTVLGINSILVSSPPSTSQQALAQTNATQEAANETEASASRASSGALTAINQTGQFVGNVTETVVENPVVSNATTETQEFFADKSK